MVVKFAFVPDGEVAPSTLVCVAALKNGVVLDQFSVPLDHIEDEIDGVWHLESHPCSRIIEVDSLNNFDVMVRFYFFVSQEKVGC